MHQITILCTGDLHIGRVSSKCRPEGDNGGSFTVRNTWMRIVDCAIAREADLLLLSGDIADDGSNQYEAMGPFEAGVARLAEHGIAVYLVAGNHDAHTLPRLTALLDSNRVRLLGRDGSWEQVDWPAEGPARVSLLGWSYPAGRRVAKLPVEELAAHPRPGVPVIALAHTDYRTSAGDYAAVSIEALRRTRHVDAWLLGHIHAPELLDGTPLILNPGSPQALDPGEPGSHGPWLMEIVDGRITGVEQLPLSSVAYCTLSVDVTGMADDDELMGRLKPAVDEQLRAIRREGAAPRLACRVALTGRTNQVERLCTDRQRILRDQPLLEAYDIYLERIDLTGIAPAHDLHELRQQNDAIGKLATILYLLEQGSTDGEVAPYLFGAHDIVQRILDAANFPEPIPRDGLPSPEALLKAECGRLLDALLRQQGAPS